eukprot:TRINITY_DN5081_c0_g1_i4.p1 TRINITY_DN5081_c0_g1~~TRINITY_DN5081_c0_g1_i4.p1  ORF type:complete len:1146 (+),score=205.31 TRINITY_DN5081_c0_g1_i4:126-3563(+)
MAQLRRIALCFAFSLVLYALISAEETQQSDAPFFHHSSLRHSISRQDASLETSEPFTCDVGTIYNNCEILTPKYLTSNLTIFQSDAILLLHSGGAIICDAQACRIDMVFSTITLKEGSLIRANGIVMDAQTIMVAKNATIRTDGTSLVGEFPEPGAGASHAGLGDSCKTLSNPTAPYGSASTPCNSGEQGSASSVGNVIVGGGGYISIIATAKITVDGEISSSGASAPLQSGLGGGSGGCVQLLTNQLNGVGIVRATGGDGGTGKGFAEGGGGGSGGRVLINRPSSDGKLAFDASGGFSRCEEKTSGAAGSLFISISKTVEIDSRDRTAPTLTYHSDDKSLVNSLVIKNFARVTSSGNSNTISTAKSIIVSDSAEISGASSIIVSSESVTVRKSSSISCGIIAIDTKNFTLDRSSSIEEKEVSLVVSDFVEISGYLRAESLLSISAKEGSKVIVNVTSTGLASSANTKIQASQIWVDGRMSNLGTFCPSECSKDTSPRNYGMELHSSDYIHVGKKGSILSGYLLLNSLQVINYGYISASGTGCTSDNGPGKGLAELQGPGGGGGHGSRGGNGTNLGVTNIGGSSYDLPSNPVCPGSGGGSTSRYSGGSGGGVLIIYATSRLVNDNFLISDGRPGATGEYPGGGGAGGSIQIHAPVIQGSGSITAIGGAGAQGLGGGGSGGCIRFYLSTAKNDEGLAKSGDDFTFPEQNVQAGGGFGAQYGGNGMIYSTPCYPGYFGQFCLPCPVGTFKSENGTIGCVPCSNKPAYSRYTDVGVESAYCPYRCDDGRESPDCSTLFEGFVNDIGGTEAALGILWLVMSVSFAFTSRKITKQLKEAKDIRSLWETWYHTAKEDGNGCSPDFFLPKAQGKNRDDSSGFISYRVYDESLAEDKRMAPTDVKHHLTRLYFWGDNTYTFPWRLQMIPANHELKIKKAVLEKEYKIFTHLCNEHAAWKTWEGLTYFLLIFMYPLAKLFQSWRRKVHVGDLEDFVRNFYKDTFLRSGKSKAHLNPIKFGTTSDFSMAYIDILQYEVSSTLTVGCPKFPMILLLSGNGTFLSPYNLNLEDVYSASLFMRCEYHDWTQFALEFNNIIRYSSNDLPHSLRAVVDFLERCNHQLFQECRFHISIGRYNLIGEGPAPLVCPCLFYYLK